MAALGRGLLTCEGEARAGALRALRVKAKVGLSNRAQRLSASPSPSPEGCWLLAHLHEAAGTTAICASAAGPGDTSVPVLSRAEPPRGFPRCTCSSPPALEASAQPPAFALAPNTPMPAPGPPHPVPSLPLAGPWPARLCVACAGRLGRLHPVHRLSTGCFIAGV